MQNGPLETRGWLDVASLEGGVLRLEGWAASFVEGSAKNLSLSCAGERVNGYDLDVGLPSPDVKDAFPTLPGAESARFRLALLLSRIADTQFRDQLLTLTPIFGGRPGWGWFRVFEPSLPIPAQASIDSVGGHFLPVAFEFLGHLVNAVGLRRTDAVLDVGCGTGRMAYSLAYYLTRAARYEGFDVVESLIRSAETTIGSRFENFAFRAADVYNRMYNSGGTLSAARFRFPYEDSAFDVVFLTSVFTHVVPAELRHYLDEIHRVLKPGGRCLVTCFLLNEESQRLIGSGKSHVNLVHPLDHCFTADPSLPENAVGFLEPLFAQWVHGAGLSPTATYYGSWCGRQGVTYQDMVTLIRP